MSKLFCVIILTSFLFSCSEDPSTLACHQSPHEIYEDPNNVDSLLRIGSISQVTKACCPEIFVFYLPTAFTPDGDGLNETFKPFGLGFDVQSMKFERPGQLIEIQEPSWDGTNNMGNAPQGLYLYSIVVKTWTNEIRTITGQVALIRDENFDKCNCFFEDQLDPTRGFLNQSLEGC